jgi:hypothetical protein
MDRLKDGLAMKVPYAETPLVGQNLSFGTLNDVRAASAMLTSSDRGTHM